MTFFAFQRADAGSATNHDIGHGWLHRPLMWIFPLYAGGVSCGAFCGFLSSFNAWALAAGCVLVWLVLRLAENTRALPRRYLGMAALFFLGLAWFFTGWSALIARVDDSEKHALADVMQRQRESLELQGRIVDNPVYYPGMAGRSGIWRFTLDVQAVRRLPDWQPVEGRARVLLPARDTARPQYDAVWRLSGVITDLRRLEMAKVDYDWRIHVGDVDTDPPHSRPAAVSFLPQSGGYFFFRADPGASVEFIAPRGNFAHRLYQLRERAGFSLRQGLTDYPDVAAVLRALALGYRGELSPDDRRLFIYTGTFHLFAISGLHMSLLAMFIVFWLAVAGVSRIYWFPVVAPVLLVFTFMVGMPPSAVRGSLMTALWLLAPLVGRRGDGFSAWALTGLIILAFDPVQLFTRGFMLSFVVVAGLLFFTPRWLDYEQKGTGGVLEGGRNSGVRRMIPAVLWRWLRAYAVISLVAWLVSMPLIARWYNLWSPLAPLANIPAIPLAALILGLGFLAVMAGFLHPSVAVAVNLLAVVPVRMVQMWLSFIQNLPFSQLFVKAPPWWTVLCWYGGLLLLAGRRRRILCRVAALILLTVWPIWNLVDGRAGRIQVLNAGGVAVLMGNSANRLNWRAGDWLVNAGSRRYTRSLTGLIQRSGVNTLDAWLVTRPDARHIAGAESFWESGYQSLRMVIYPADIGRRFRIFNSMRDDLEQSGVSMRTLGADERATVAGIELCALPSDTAGAMGLSLGRDNWRLDIRSDNCPVMDEPGMCILVSRSLSGASDAFSTAARPESKRIVHIKCAPHSFGSPFINHAGLPGLRLAPGQILTLDFEPENLRLRWTDTSD